MIIFIFIFYIWLDYIISNISYSSACIGGGVEVEVGKGVVVIWDWVLGDL